MTRTAFLLFGLLISSVLLAAEPPPEGVRTYDPNPRHPWNRLHETLFVRVAPDGTPYGHDRLDPLYWGTTRQLLEEPSRRTAVTVLDEFLRKDSDKLIRDPLRRALLQHDLWALFDWSASPYAREYVRERAELQLRLAPIIRRLALTSDEIAALADNYARAIASNTPTSLPQGLLLRDGDWVNVAASTGTARAHVRNFGGRSTFHLLLRLPEGRAATLAYLEKLRAFEHLASMPQFPSGTEWALVRRMRIIDADGRIRPTSFIESIQLRRYVVVPETGEFASREAWSKSQQMFEFVASRVGGGDLREVQSGERDFYQFQAHDTDPFELSAEALAYHRDPDPFRNRHQQDVLRSCSTCHFAAGIYSVQSLAQMSHDRMQPVPKLSEADSSQILSEVVYGDSYQFGLLRGLWERARRP